MLLLQGMWVQSLVWELRSQMLHTEAKRKKGEKKKIGRIYKMREYFKEDLILYLNIDLKILD